MSLETSEVRAGITGELYAAPVGTALPTDTSTALNAAFKGLGYFSEDGVTETFEKDTEDITAWQNEGTYTINPGATSGRLSWVLEVIDGAEIKRIVLEEGEITELGETSYATGEAIGYAMTLEAYTDPVVIDTALKS
jgi:hypothetical protein